MVEISHGTAQPASDHVLFDHARNPWSGSPTALSLAQKQRALNNVPGAVKQVPSEQFDNKFAVTLKDMLSGTPGVFVQQRYGEEARLSIRGSGIGRSNHLRGINLLQDGVPINLADGGGDFQEIDPLTLRALEVYKGGNGMAFGASSLGGAINAVTPTGHTAVARNRFSQEVGSFGTVRSHASVARVMGDADFYAAVTGLTSDGYRDQSAQRKGRFNGNLGVRLNDAAETRFYVGYNTLDQEVPGTLTLREALDRPRTAPLLNRVNDYARDIRSLRLANKTSFTLDGALLDVGVYANLKDLFHPIFAVIDQESQTYGGFTRLTVPGQIGGHRNEASATLNVITGKTDALQYTNVRGSRGIKTADTDQNANQFDLYGQDQFYMTPDWSVIGGLQLVQAERDFTNNFNNAANDSRAYHAVNPKIGTVYDVRRDAQIFANITRSSEAPTFSELVQAPIVGFVPLDQQTAWTAEVGARGHRAGLAWDIAAYRSWLDGELLNFTVNQAVPAATFNAGETVHQGIEAGVDWDVGKRLLLPKADSLILRQIYALNDFRFRNDPQFGDNRIAGTPPHLYRVELRYRHTRGWSITPNVEAVPHGGYVDHANNLKAPGYAVAGLNATYPVRRCVDLFADARNLFDKRYVSNYSTITNANVAATNVFYPGEGRSLFVGLKVSF